MGRNALTNDDIDARIAKRPLLRIGNYVGSVIKLNWKCKTCDGDFAATPNNVLNNGSNCPHCFGNIPLTNNIIDERLVGRAITRRDDVTNAVTPMPWLCGDCGKKWVSTPDLVLNTGSGCHHCSKNYSNKAINWLNRIQKETNQAIQHAENGGEYSIPDTRFKADGYCIDTNTIYEFYGDLFHGNPNVFAPTDCCHPHNPNTTAAELFRKTMKRELIIKSLGYSMVSIWEFDYNKYLKNCVAGDII